MKRILLATTNQNKIREIRAMVEGMDIELVTLDLYPDIVAPEETCTTFYGNAKLKHDYYRSLTGEIVLAEDSGLCVDALEDGPGVYSARYGKTSEEKIARLLDELQDVTDPEERSAYYMCTAVVTNPNNFSEVLSYSQTFDGQISLKPSGVAGFGYDPIFYVPDFGRTVSELSPRVKNLISHRRAVIFALEKLSWEK